MRVLFFNRNKVATCIILTVFIIYITFLFTQGRGALPVSADSDGNESIKVPIIMYHSILNDHKRAGDYVVSQQTLENDIVYLKENGYTTVVMQDLIDYVYNGKPLPDKPVVLTFDDGYYNNFVYLLPLLEKHDCKAVISVVGKFTEIFSESDDLNPNYSHLSWDTILQLKESGRIEIQNHSYDLHDTAGRKGSQKLKRESVEEYQNMLRNDLSKLQNLLEENCGIIPNTYTYPYGAISEESKDVVKELGFKASLSCYEFVNEITRDKECLYGMGRYNRPSGISTEKFMKKALEHK